MGSAAAPFIPTAAIGGARSLFALSLPIFVALLASLDVLLVGSSTSFRGVALAGCFRAVVLTVLVALLPSLNVLFVGPSTRFRSLALAGCFRAVVLTVLMALLASFDMLLM